MSLIDLKKLNAEVDELIRRQDEEVKAMHEERQIILDQAFMWMVTDLVELNAIAGEVLEYGDEMRVETEIKSHYGSPTENYGINFNKANKSHVYMDVGVNCYVGCVRCDETHRSSYERNKKNLHDLYLSADLDGILREWRKQYPIFKQRFEEECLKEIKRKAERANARYESARRELDETK